MSSAIAYPPSLRFTYRDYCLRDDGKRWELIGGDFFMAPAPSEPHQRFSRNLEMLLWRFISDHDLGEVYYAPFDVILSDEDVVQPDILFVGRENKERIRENGLHGAPDLVIEILSPSTAQRDLEVKDKLYARHGVKEFWIVDPDGKTITMRILTKQGYTLRAILTLADTLTTDLLPGLEIPLDKVFR